VPRPRSLTPARLVAATLAVIDRDGLDALTMRIVAKELGMATMSLYRYVSDRHELEVLVVDHVLGAVDVALPPGDWREQIAVLLRRLRTAVREHPATVPLLLRHVHTSPASLHWIEATLTALTAAGFGGAERVVAQRTVVSFLLGTLQNEYYRPLSGTGTAAMARLSSVDYPLVSETAATALELRADDEFERGMAIVLRGLVPGGGEVL
jgi:AcrR family transcriptional regulator